ncbi:hypothetical protein [Mesobacterium pallidum]|uniref:hypothetical protein n=1 Tax=Mesobacterium pallidum TaxID=2872037 RepID=UPI001EE25796|nr:hypothetical protein [Mesobacterium pallidum]
MRAALILCLALAAPSCGRVLTEHEKAFAGAIFADQVDVDRVRFSGPLLAGSFTYQRPARPRVTCTERLYPPIEAAEITVSPAAMAVFNHVRYREDLWREDYLEELPEILSLPEAMLFAHEMTHVWQWQNRDRTGYHPLRAAGEHSASPDPYLFDPETEVSFLSHGYEQQGAIVEEYLCCRVLAPDAARTARLHAMLSAEFPVTDLRYRLADRVRLPWKGAEIEGICD